MKASEIIAPYWNIVREDQNGNAIIECDGKFHVVFVNASAHTFESAIPADGRWSSSWTEDGLKYVSKGRSRAAANYHWRKSVAVSF